MAPDIRVADLRIRRDLNTVITRHGEARLTPRAMDVLCYLADRADRVVPRSELLEAFWPDHPGGEDALAHMIREIRKALDDDARRQHIIQTIPRKGYRLVANRTGARRRIRAASLLGLALVIALIGGLTLEGDKPPPAGTSVAVLPFRSMGEDPETRYFADGLTEEIMNALASIPELQVASRTSSFALRGRDLETAGVAKQLGVRNILEGSVRRDDQQFRIIVQLVDTDADQQVWSRSYTTVLDEVLPTQIDIARSVAGALGVRLIEGEAPATEFDGDPLVLDFYFRGRGYFRLQTREGYENAIAMFKAAVERDESFAPAWAWLGIAQQFAARFYDRRSDRVSAAIASGKKAVELAPQLPEAHTALALALATNDQHEEALREHARATQLDPSDFFAHYYAGGTAFRAGLFDLAVRRWTRATEIDPADERPLRLLPQAYRRLDEPAKERAAWLRLISILEERRMEEPNHPLILASGAAAFQAIGDDQRAREWLDSMLALAPDDAVILYNAACFFAKEGEADQALALLRSAYENGWLEWQWMESDADLDALRDLPEFQQLMMEVRSAYRLNRS